ncbi:MAG TPA: hypothetical protein VKY74_20885 [Chloroflexia bacterium]|nr:hypothetical protein [Chloroflexia bacterium]
MSDPTGHPAESRPLLVVDRVTRFASEELARTIDRRAFLKRAGSGAFLFLLTLASGRALTARAAGANAVGPNVRPTPAPLPPNAPVVPNCAPPGPYCNLTGVNQPDGCHGAHCFQHLYNSQVLQCQVYYTFYAGGCWTASGTGGFWTCCDCSCGGGITHCGCAQFSGTPYTDVN